MAAARSGDDDADGISRTLLDVVTDWPGHFPHGAESVAALVAARADVNARLRGPHGETPLYWAASSNDVEVLDALPDGGADIEAPGAMIAGGTPLAEATRFAQWQAPRRLVGRGAQVNLFAAGVAGADRRARGFHQRRKPSRPRSGQRHLLGCCHGGQQPATAYLLDHGAVPH